MILCVAESARRDLEVSHFEWSAIEQKWLKPHL